MVANTKALFVVAAFELMPVWQKHQFFAEIQVT
jgi:hypothetical protein